jgi:hypothetical protein
MRRSSGSSTAARVNQISILVLAAMRLDSEFSDGDAEEWSGMVILDAMFGRSLAVGIRDRKQPGKGPM